MSPLTVSIALSGPLEFVLHLGCCWCLLYFLLKINCLCDVLLQNSFEKLPKLLVRLPDSDIEALEGKGLVFTIFWRPEASFMQVCFDSYQVLGSPLMLFSQESPKHENPASWMMRSRQDEKSKTTQQHILFGGPNSANNQTCSLEWISAPESKAGLVKVYITSHPTGAEWAEVQDYQVHDRVGTETTNIRPIC